jgi:DNA-binding NarL/FixJ family response regulator
VIGPDVHADMPRRTEPKEPRTLIVADDHPLFRRGVMQTLSQSTEFRVVGEAENGGQALEMLETLRPDLALVDISMPDMDGLRLIRTAIARGIRCSFVILTMFRDDEYFTEAMDLGVMGYILKDGASDEVISCLRTVASGKHYVSPVMSELLVLRARGAGKAPAGSLASLSPTEHRIVKMIAEGKTSKEIGDELNISVHTVNNHRAHICEKLRLEGPNRLLQFAIEHKSVL